MTVSVITRPERSPRRSGLLMRLASLRGLGRQRTRLSQLEAHMLEDIGVSEAEARKEARRPFWDAPATWRN